MTKRRFLLLSALVSLLIAVPGVALAAADTPAPVPAQAAAPTVVINETPGEYVDTFEVAWDRYRNPSVVNTAYLVELLQWDVSAGEWLVTKSEYYIPYDRLRLAFGFTGMTADPVAGRVMLDTVSYVVVTPVTYEFVEIGTNDDGDKLYDAEFTSIPAAPSQWSAGFTFSTDNVLSMHYLP